MLLRIAQEKGLKTNRALRKAILDLGTAPGGLVATMLEDAEPDEFPVLLRMAVDKKLWSHLEEALLSAPDSLVASLTHDDLIPLLSAPSSGVREVTIEILGRIKGRF